MRKIAILLLISCIELFPQRGIATSENNSVVEVDLNNYEKKVFSQFDEDGILDKIFSLIGTHSKTYVEFGASDGRECNTHYLREVLGWTGLLMDGGFENLQINLRRHFITTRNINQLFQRYNIPKEFDLLSIDVDGNDFYIWKKICEEYYTFEKAD